MIDTKLIKPAQRGRADFFSWQLYRWVKDRSHMLQIWRGTWNNASGIDRDQPVLYIGYMDTDVPGEKWFHGRNLKNLCCHGQKIEGYAYGPAHDTANWKEVTEDWWAEYMRIGVCAIHGDYAHDWDEQGGTRTCRRCLKEERRVVEMVERASWVDAV